MDQHSIHQGHAHQHRQGCGHKTIEHDGHRDYLHDGHLHYVHGDHYDEHSIEISAQNPQACTPNHACGAHPSGHKHGPACGHDAIPHGDHVDYLCGGHLHFPHGAHCDDHGAVRVT